MNLDTLSPLWLPDLVNRAHPLNRGRLAWWLTVPGLDGGRYLYDLMSLYPGTLTNMGSSSGWRGTTRPGGWGHLVFDGTNDCILPAGNPHLKLGTTYTVALWAKLPSTPSGGSYNSFFSCQGLAGGGSAVTYWNIDQYDGDLRFVVEDNGAAHLAMAYGYPFTPKLAGNTWYRIVGTRSGNSVSLYVNGTLYNSSSASLGTLSNTAAPVIGASYASSASPQYFTAASMDDIGIWTRAFSSSDVWADLRASSAGYAGALTRWGGAGALVGDASGAAPPGISSNPSARRRYIWPGR